MPVADTGRGIPKDIAEKIYDPFFTTKEIGKGTGLGLSMVYDIVKNHGGNIHFDSTMGKGTTFYIELPSTTAKLKPAKPVTANATSRRADRTVLVVDDEEMLRDLTAEGLSREGYKVLTAANGKEGVAIFEKHFNEIGVVVLDMNMPVMSGVEALGKIRCIKPNAKVLLVTGYIENDAARATLSDQNQVVLDKPYTLATLSAKILDAMQN
jgi:CheY-like chemotaxis protein